MLSSMFCIELYDTKSVNPSSNFSVLSNAIGGKMSHFITGTLPLKRNSHDEIVRTDDCKSSISYLASVHNYN